MPWSMVPQLTLARALSYEPRASLLEASAAGWCLGGKAPTKALKAVSHHQPSALWNLSSGHPRVARVGLQRAWRLQGLSCRQRPSLNGRGTFEAGRVRHPFLSCGRGLYACSIGVSSAESQRTLPYEWESVSRIREQKCRPAYSLGPNACFKAAVAQASHGCRDPTRRESCYRRLKGVLSPARWSLDSTPFRRWW